MIEADKLTKYYDRFTAIRDVSFNMVNSFRIQAVRATFLALPAAHSR